MQCSLLTAARVGKVLCLLGMLFTGAVAWGQEARPVATPYFHVSGNDDGKECFPLKSTRADDNLLENGKVLGVLCE